MHFLSRTAARSPRVPALFLLLGMSLAALACGAQAQPQAPAAPISPAMSSLPQALAAAWQRQPEAASSELHREAAQGRKSAAQGWTAEPPALELSSQTDRLNRNQGARELELSLALPLWLPGERGRSQALADAELAVLDSRLAAARWRLAGVLREAWWGLHRARVETALAKGRQDSAARLVRDVRRRVAAGELARADQHQAEGALAAAQAELAASQAALLGAEQGLRALTDETPAATLADGAEALAAPLQAEAAEIPDHPALRELSDRAQWAERARDLASVQQRANPELTLSATRDRGAFGERYGQSLTLGLRFPLGSSGAQQAKRATAAAELVEARTLLTRERQRLQGELHGARARLDAARLGAEAATRRAQLARETLGFVEQSFRAGETDLPGRLRVELEAFEAERQAQLARLNVNQAISALNQAQGLLPQ